MAKTKTELLNLIDDFIKEKDTQTVNILNTPTTGEGLKELLKVMVMAIKDNDTNNLT